MKQRRKANCPRKATRSFLMSALLLVLMCASCDSTDVPEQEQESLKLTPQSSLTLSNGSFSIEQRQNRPSSTGNGKWYRDPANSDTRVPTIFDSGIWIAADQGSPRSNVSTWIPNDISGFEFVSTETGDTGIFVVTRDSLEFQILNWPEELGAPTEMDGSPKMFGDVMAWAAYQPSTAPGSSDTSIEGLRVGMTIYLFNDEPLANAYFVRYSIQNTSSEPLSNVHVGNFADTDFGLSRSDGERCGNYAIGNFENQTGYDLSEHVSYTYMSPHLADGDLPDDCYGTVVGYSILDMSTPDGLGASKMAHRIVRRDHGATFPAFAEEDISNSEILMRALKGLSPSGNSMVDPTTGQETKFAFTGDPVTGSGWIDDRYDVRSLQSISPFDIPPGEKRIITVAWFAAHGENLETGLSSFRAQYQYVMSRRDVWDY